MNIFEYLKEVRLFLRAVPKLIKWIEFSESRSVDKSIKYFHDFLSKNMGRILRDCHEYACTSYGRYDGYDDVIDRIRSISYNLDEQYGPKIELGIPGGYTSGSAYREALIFLKKYCCESKKFAGKIAKAYQRDEVPQNVSYLLQLSREIENLSRECLAILNFPRMVVVLGVLAIILFSVTKLIG